MLIFFEKIGDFLISKLRLLGSLVIFAVRAITLFFLPPYRIGLFIEQMHRVGVQSLPIVALTAFSSGLVLVIQMAAGFRRFGVESYIAGVVGVAILRELGPVLTALMVAGRVGSGITAELGSMRVTEQIDALEVSALNPMKYLVSIRILAVAIMVPLLTIIADFLGIFGGYLIGVFQLKIMPALYISRTLEFLSFDDFIPGIIKGLFFGLIIGVISCYKGYNVVGGGEGVGQETTASVVLCSVWVLIADVILTKFLIALFGG